MPRPSPLNEPQREAVAHGSSPLLVLAGAGSGKTRVIAYRIAEFLRQGVAPEKICALSFTNKAAAELRERVGALVGHKGAKKITMSTFHSLGLRILKKEYRALGYPARFAIYDTTDQLGAIREILRAINFDDRRFDSKAILQRISRAKNAFVHADEYSGRDGDDYDEITEVVYPKYQAALGAFAALDFDDLVVAPIRLLQQNGALRMRWQNQFSHLLVDEYQDTNRAQLLLLRNLAGDNASVTVVGDDDQSIYSWRGAEASNILDFERHFAGARVIKLEQNYRSTSTILAAANAVIKNNSVRHEKTLWSDSADGDRVVIACCPDAASEANFVCDEMARLQIEDRRTPGDFAVLYRSNLQARILEETLLSRRVSFDLVGGQQFYERKEVKDVIAYLKVALNPRDEIALRRTINYPARGIGPVTVSKAAAYAEDKGITLCDALARAQNWSDEVRAGTLTALDSYLRLLEDTRRQLRSGRCAEAARTLVENIRLHQDLRAGSPSLSAAQRRIDNVQEFLRSLEEQQKKKPGADALADYLHFLTLNTTDEEDNENATQNVTLTTIHGAKGLEWPVVFLVGMEEEFLPHARTLNPHDQDIAGDADISEERRLAYVAITRARERLYLTLAANRVQHRREVKRVPSRFLGEIPAELLEFRDVVAEARAPVDRDEMRAFFRSMGNSEAKPEA